MGPDAGQDVISSAPGLVVPLLVVVSLLAWLLKGKIDDGEIRGVRAARDAARDERDVYKARLDVVGDKATSQHRRDQRASGQH